MPMAELTPEGREQAVAELGRIEATLAQMSQWVDGGSPDRERCAVLLEDASLRVMAAALIIERDPARVAELVHRRMPANGHPGA